MRGGGETMCSEQQSGICIVPPHVNHLSLPLHREEHLRELGL